MGISSAYSTVVEREGLVQDPAQQEVVDILRQLQIELGNERTAAGRFRRLFARLRGRPSAGVRGIYLWGGVGRGKTFLMDLFYSTLTTERKRRMHFHEMMSEIHARLRIHADTEDPADKVAAEIANETSVLCFDEFFVSDIGDAMILGRLLNGLFCRGTVLVATSNTPPDELYADGLQRERFLPAIDLLKKHAQIVHLDTGTDYRLRMLKRAGTYLTPDDADAEKKLEEFFHSSAATASAMNPVLEILGRPVTCRRCTSDVAWFDFSAICDGPRSVNDYIEIARRFQTIIISKVPVLRPEAHNAARRFISLIDEFYDRRVKLVVSAEAPIDRLYQGKKLAFEFRRTASRLTEMQSSGYLHAAHRG
ncbi:MAG: cell division protein ZapE [Gammaproteobacteria bacterium]|nr:cell division protein ZapE [Gammaproteobacteria bacterium]MDH4313827.1 cell division protein ZapE [Gammaproteobacteria bacterium]MDH5213695.1 cell division protein ZapE [Gammaproteobacteria bacterium]MDH5500293.1 cell division protein ZapE [Gammaproteobacteria bacterium]